MAKKLGWVLFSLIILVMSWEDQRSVAALFAEGPIPEQSIRLRIIANSDLPEDQALKREVRDEVNAYIASKVENLADIQEAREKISKELPQLKKIVDQTVEAKGYTYNTKVEMGVVPFPTKMYGQYVYPAGDYEALRVTIGSGLGQNWWCVLFPPLCFVDIANGDAVKKDKKETSEKKESGEVEVAAGEEAPQIEVKFFIVEWIQKIFNLIFD
ncbi:stage II sporulation protein R [Ammoniphilus resinae]|uniref:Stage II sporulation protein R n=1 Tax=Ammoniphilus resinae TaxID=861532 RepID=A0ABS4GUQ7_9BACL|nr:stage II sporulation protein R [Ammoniphilus resinae]MBP1934008.1 stage II sporulation protein R [Ammoniphilus resinae]